MKSTKPYAVAGLSEWHKIQNSILLETCQNPFSAVKVKLFSDLEMNRFRWLLALVAVNAKKTMLDSIIYDYYGSSNEEMSFVFRRMNSTSQIGAQTSMAPGDAGTLVHVTSQAELGKFLMDDNYRQFSPFTILMEIGLLDDTNAKVLRDNADRVSVLLTYRNESYGSKIRSELRNFFIFNPKKASH